MMMVIRRSGHARSHRRWLGLSLLGLLACGGAWFYVEYFLKRPVGQGPAGPGVASELFHEAWSDRQVELLGMGDSITAGLGAKNSSHSYFNRLHTNPSDEFETLKGLCLSAVLPNLATENLAVSGTTSLHHEEMLSEKLTPRGEGVFGIVVLTTGGNDIVHFYGRAPPREGAMYGATLPHPHQCIENFRQRLDRMLARIEECFPGGCEIYLADIYDPTDGVGDGPSLGLPVWKDGLKIHAAYNEVLRSAAAQRANVILVPLHATFLGHGSHCRQFWRSTYRSDDPHYWFFENVEDPNDRGYDAIRRVFLNSIARHTLLREPK